LIAVIIVFVIIYLVFFNGGDGEVEFVGNQDSNGSTADEGLQNDTVPAPTSEVTILGDNEATYKVETARTDSEQRKGLMYRESMPIDQGMLFVYEEDVKYPFWMKDCLFHLDIIFIDKDLKIVDIFEYAIPCDEEDEKDCPLYGGTNEYRYVLEINGKEVTKYGINIGDKIILDL